MNSPRSTITIRLRHGIWRVSVDGHFHGDHRSRRDAEEAADQIARALAVAPRITVEATESDKI